MSTHDLIRRGARKRISSDHQTNIWTDPWLPDDLNPFIETRIQPELVLASVYSLRCLENGSWDLYILKDLFSARDRCLIQSIPLSNYENDHKWMWSEEQKGAYTVKSGYQLLMQA